MSYLAELKALKVGKLGGDEEPSEPAPVISAQLHEGIRRMAERWQYSAEELVYALQKAAEDPIAWRDFVADDERSSATRH